MNTNRNITIIILLAIIVVTVAIVKNEKANKPEIETGPINIGVVAPFSGDAAAYGEPVQKSLQLMSEKLAVQNGINGRPVKFIYEDGKCDGKTAAAAAQKLISVDRVSVIIGGICSGETLAMAPIAEAAHVVLISPGSTAPAISQSGDYVFRVAFSDVLSAQSLAITMKTMGASHVAIVSEQTDFAQAMKPAFVDYAKVQGMNIDYDESFMSDTNDFATIATKIKSRNVDSVYINTQTGASAAKIAKALRERGSTAQFYTYFLSGSDFVASGDAVNGTYVLDVGSVANASIGGPFMQEYIQRYGSEPEYAWAATFSYDTASIILNAIQSVGNNAESIQSYLYTMPSYTGIAGNITFDNNGDAQGTDVFILKQIKNGKLESVK